jgi:hypothetical protein
MVVPLAAVAGKKAVNKAADNPAGSIFLVVLVGAVLIQSVKNLPDLGSFLWGKLPVPDLGLVKAPYTWTREAIETTAALNDEVITGFEQIGPEQDPVEQKLFGSFARAGPDEIEEPGDWQKAYRGARTGLFTGLFNRGWFY